MTIAKNSVASINYTLKDDNGKVLDTSDGAEPLAYIHGLGHIIPGLEEALEGKVQGDSLQVTIPPEKAYGPRVEQMIQTVPRSEFASIDKIEPGMQFQVDTSNGPMVFTVLEVKEEEVILDGNHPLAGETLHFELEIMEVRTATEEELSHGHVHGAGGVKH